MSDPGSLVAQVEGERIGIIGGTFDPIHYAHLAIAEEVYCALSLERVIFVPAGEPPHKIGYSITPAHHRLAMLKLALADNPHFTFSLVDLQRSGPSYTVETLQLLRQELGPRAQCYFIIGGDSLRDLPTWRDPAGILNQATVVALTRPGYKHIQDLRAQLEAQLPRLRSRLITLEGPLMEISSTDLRRRVAGGRPIKYQVPEPVEHYIFQHQLYTGEAVAHDATKSSGQRQGNIHAADAI